MEGSTRLKTGKFGDHLRKNKEVAQPAVVN
jgi:hypothetical protein